MSRQPHKHAELIKAWADGAEIEYKSEDDGVWRVIESPSWQPSKEYRIKPEPKPDVVRDVFITEHVAMWNQQCPNLRLTFSGETGELIKAEVLK